MRIAIFSECYLPVTNGVVTSIHTLRETLRAWGHTVYVFAPGSPQPEDDAHVFRLPELPFPNHPYHFARPFPRLHVDFENLDVDVIHCQHPFTVGKLGAELARKHTIPMVYTAHSLYDTMAACHKSPIMRTVGPRAARGVVKRFCAKADYVIAPSRYTRDALRAGGVSARYVVIPSGVIPLESRPEARTEIRARLGMAPETPLLLYVGRLGPEKRLDVLLGAAGLLSARGLPGAAHDFRLALVGDGMSREELEERARALGIRDRVTFAGALPHTQVGDWYAASDLFAMPSPAETQGLVLIEAMAAGLPCVTADYGGVRELVSQGETGVRVPTDENAFARALDLLLRDPAVRRRMGEKGRARATGYSPDVMTKRILGVYENAIRLPRRPRENGVKRLLATEINLTRRKFRRRDALPL